jgi:predicted permease
MPDWITIVQQRLAPLRMTPAAESELAEELAQDLDDRYRDLRSAGIEPEEAYRRVIAELDDVYPLRAGLERSQIMPKYDAVAAGEIRRGNLADDLARDLRYAVRSIRKNPVFVLFVVLTMALGIGANTTVFTVVNALILHPLPVPNIGRLAAIAVSDSQATSKSAALFPLSYPDLQDYQKSNQVFHSLAGYTSPRVLTWQENSTSERAFAEMVTGNYFTTLGLTPAKGRFFGPEEDTVTGQRPVAVLNYGTWQTRFGGVPDIVGKTLLLNHVAFTVIGVAPPQFIGVNGIFGPDFWIPAVVADQLLPTEMKNVLTDRSKALFQGVAQFQPGISREQAQANMSELAANVARAYPSTGEGHTITVRPIRDALFSSAASGSGPILFGSAVLLIVVAIVLLIACSNVANLLLARSAGRRQEMAIRLAMGASRRRLIRQLLTESVLLGLLSGIVGVFVGSFGLRALMSSLPGSSNFIAPRLDLTVLAYALLISLATGLLFGLIPALRASRTGAAEALKETRSLGASKRKVTVANVLLVGQVAFSFLLLVTAAVVLRSIQNAYRIDPGFQTAKLAVFPTNPGQAGYAPPQTKVFYEDARERVSRLPGVASASWSSNMPLWARSAAGLELEGRQQRSRADNLRTVVNVVDRDYFATTGVTILQGREFSNLDRDTSMPVAIINEKLANDYWPGGALGKRLQLPGEKVMRQVVGIARVANYSTWGESPQLCVYIPLAQHFGDLMVLYVRSKASPRDIMVPVERELHAVAPQILVSSPMIGSAVVDGGLFQARIGVALLSVFGMLALGLASIGLYGILAYSVNQRKREIGLRMALGAAQSTVLRQILKQGMMLVLTGVVIGFGASLAAGGLLSRILYGVSATDPLSMTAAALVLLAVALLACYLPARWASRVDPLDALREV